jgi:hypothetical protein
MKHIVLFVILGATILAQGDLEVFGFFQSRYMQYNQYTNFEFLGKKDNEILLYHPETGQAITAGQILETEKLYDVDRSFTSSSLQQLNLFFNKQLTENFQAWINFEYINSFDSEKDWGSAKIEEAWVKYTWNPELSFKFGVIVPKFNNLNEVKNKMPYLPYIDRPLIYETSYARFLESENFTPQRAFFQTEYSAYIKDLMLNITGYFGDSEPSYFYSNKTTQLVPTGNDSTVFFMYGGRIGAEYNIIKAGISFTADKDRKVEYHKDTGTEIFQENVPRIRFGIDLSLNYEGIFTEFEYISVTHDTKKHKPSLLNPLVKSKTEYYNFDKLFIYGLLGYNFVDEFGAYYLYSYLEDGYLRKGAISAGVSQNLLGVVYRPDFAIAIKASYSQFLVDDGIIPVLGGNKIIANLDYNQYSIAISVLF